MDFTVTIVDPCTVAEISIPSWSTSFPPMQYSLRDPAQTYSWDPITDLAIDTSATCTLQSDVYQIFASSIEVAPDSTLFTYTSGANEFLINYTEDV